MLTPENFDTIERDLKSMIMMGAAEGAPRNLEREVLTGLQQLREREETLMKLVEELREALPRDKRSYRGLKARVDAVLAPPPTDEPEEEVAPPTMK